MNNTAHYYSKFGGICPLEPVTASIHHRFNVLTIGDSLEIHACFNWTVGVKNQFLYNAKSGGIFHCGNKNNINLFMTREYGAQGLIYSRMNPKDKVNPKRIKDLTTSKSIAFKLEEMVADNMPDIVLFGSFLWDLKENHDQFCKDEKPIIVEKDRKKSNLIPFTELCHIKYNGLQALGLSLSELNMSSVISAVQTWQSMALPWCTASHFNEWKDYYLDNIDTILREVPHATIYLRTQPISSATFIGNYQCHRPYNAFIRHVSKLDADSYAIMRGKKNIELALLQRKVEVREGLFTLIDLDALFSSPTDTLSIFADDHIHLSAESVKVQNDYYRLIIQQHHFPEISEVGEI